MNHKIVNMKDVFNILQVYFGVFLKIMRRGFNLRRLTLIEDWMVDRLRFLWVFEMICGKFVSFMEENWLENF